MQPPPTHKLPTRREFIKTTGQAAAGSLLASMAIPHVHAAGSETLNLALIGCGGRGTGAVADAFSTSTQGPIKLVAMADVFPQKLNNSHSALSSRYSSQVEVPADRRFIGFDGYRKAMDCLKKGDIAILATPPAFRWVQFAYAIEKGINVFMEKPVTVDGPTSRRMFELGKAAERQNLKVGVGLMCRHCQARQELLKQVQNGAIGDILFMRAYRMHGPAASFESTRFSGSSELLYQIQRFHSFLWASGGAFSDFYIHNIDECCMIKGGWPVRAHGLGGRHFRGNNVDQNLDAYSVEYVFEDGARLYMEGRCMTGCHDEFASYAHGTKGLAVISTASHSPARCRIFKGHNVKSEDLVWRGPRQEPNPYELEWQDLVRAIRQNQPYNEVERGVRASLVTSMGRMAAHTGQIITYEEILNSDHEFAPGVDKLTMTSPAPLLAGADGKYPVPMPGQFGKREY